MFIKERVTNIIIPHNLMVFNVDPTYAYFKPLGPIN